MHAADSAALAITDNRQRVGSTHLTPAFQRKLVRKIWMGSMPGPLRESSVGAQLLRSARSLGDRREALAIGYANLLRLRSYPQALCLNRGMINERTGSGSRQYVRQNGQAIVSFRRLMPVHQRLQHCRNVYDTKRTISTIASLLFVGFSCLIDHCQKVVGNVGKNTPQVKRKHATSRLTMRLALATCRKAQKSMLGVEDVERPGLVMQARSAKEDVRRSANDTRNI